MRFYLRLNFDAKKGKQDAKKSHRMILFAIRIFLFVRLSFRFIRCAMQKHLWHRTNANHKWHSHTNALTYARHATIQNFEYIEMWCFAHSTNMLHVAVWRSFSPRSFSIFSFARLCEWNDSDYDRSEGARERFSVCNICLRERVRTHACKRDENICRFKQTRTNVNKILYIVWFYDLFGFTSNLFLPLSFNTFFLAFWFCLFFLYYFIFSD